MLTLEATLPPALYSARRANIGSTRAARRAGYVLRIERFLLERQEIYPVFTISR